MRICTILIFAASAFAQLSFNDLEKKIKAGDPESVLIPLIQEEGIDFPINLKYLKKMKKANFPDYIIDELVELHGPHVDRYAATHSGSTHMNTYHHSPSWYNTWWGYNLWLVNASYSNWWSPYYSMGFYPYLWSYFNDYSYGWWSGGFGYYVNGNQLTPAGYRNRYEDRERGRAVPRSGKRKTVSSSTATRSTSGRSASSPRSSGSSRSSGTRAVPKDR